MADFEFPGLTTYPGVTAYPGLYDAEVPPAPAGPTGGFFDQPTPAPAAYDSRDE